jgi:hypothetical protein
MSYDGGSEEEVKKAIEERGVLVCWEKITNVFRETST